ncbi:MAG: hypothetical protein QM718_05300 [Steroidobacteraceae bacterium]
MGGDPDSDDYEEEADEVTSGDDELDLDRVMRDMDSAKRRAAKSGGGEPAWRRLEQRLEQKHTAELISDFDDYEVGDDKPRRPGRR